MNALIELARLEHQEKVAEREQDIELLQTFINKTSRSFQMSEIYREFI